MKTFVFDFDKTLTYRDSLTEVFRRRIGEKGRLWALWMLLLKVCSKLRLISVQREKELLAQSLFGHDWDGFRAACRAVSDELSYTPLLATLDKLCADGGNRVVVVSATAQEVLERKFQARQDVLCVGTEFVYDGKIRITEHPFGKRKLQVLLDRGICEVEATYFDSASDKVLLGIAKKGFLVKEGQIIKTYDQP